MSTLKDVDPSEIAELEVLNLRAQLTAATERAEKLQSELADRDRTIGRVTIERDNYEQQARHWRARALAALSDPGEGSE